MSKLRIYCDAPFRPPALALLKSGVSPHELIFSAQPASPLADAPAGTQLGDADIAFGQPDAASLIHPERLRWVQLTSAGYTRYATPEVRAAAAARGFVITNSSSVYAEPCAEQVLAFMMAQTRQLVAAVGVRCAIDSPQRDAFRRASDCLPGQRVVLLGLGAIATRLLELLAPFRMSITGMRRQARGNEGIPLVSPDRIREALATADHVIDLLPENAETQHFVSAERLGWMKPGAIFYNIGRGTTVDQDALAASLASGHLGAAWLDVTEPEMLPEGHPLLSAPRCHITPHLAGGHKDEEEDLVHHFLQNLERFVAQSTLRDRVI